MSHRPSSSRRRLAAALLLAGLGAASVASPALGADEAPAVQPASTSAGGSSGGGSGGGSTGSTPSTAASGSAGAASADPLAAGRAAIAKNDFAGAITALNAAVAANPKSADATNLLAYSYRKSGNVKKALELYAVALKLDPKHLGALEYQGEAFVQSNQLPNAKANLAKLAKLCGTSCEQYKDLSAAITAASKSPKTSTKKR